MFNYIHLQAIFIRTFITFLSANLAKVNERLENRALVEQSIFEATATRIEIKLIEGIFFLVFVFQGETIQFKMGKKAHITKRLVNDLSVWFHRVGRPFHEEAISLLEDKISKVDITDKIKAIGFIDRLTYAQKEFKIDLGGLLVNELMPTRVVVRRSLFNKLTVFVDVSTNIGNGPLSVLYPTHNGVLRDYKANLNKDPVNRWLREALHDHVEFHLK